MRRGPPERRCGGCHRTPARRDLQYTLNGKRQDYEYDTAASDRGPRHAARIGANDPTARIVDAVELITQNGGPPVTAPAARPSARPFVCGAS